MIEDVREVLKFVGGSVLMIMNFVIIYFSFYMFL